MGQQVFVAADLREQALELGDQAFMPFQVGVLKSKNYPAFGIEFHTVIGFGQIFRPNGGP